MAAIYIAFGLIVQSLAAFAQTSCTFEEERRLRTVTAHFSVGPASMRMTLPSAFSVESATVFLEFDGDSPEMPREMFIESGTEKVMVKDGAALHLTPRTGSRLSFSLTMEGRPLCTWQPTIKVWPRTPPQPADGFRQLPYHLTNLAAFHKVGDPIILAVGEKLVSGSGEFRIDQLPARVLALTSWQVILRDPRPSTGLRTVESQGYLITLRFIDLQLRLPKGSGVMGISVLGLDVFKPPLYLMLFNLSGETTRLQCGSSIPHDSDSDDAKRVRLAREKGGVFTASCRVKLVKSGPVYLDGFVLQGGPFPPPLRLPRMRYSANE